MLCTALHFAFKQLKLLFILARQEGKVLLVNATPFLASHCTGTGWYSWITVDYHNHRASLQHIISHLMKIIIIIMGRMRATYCKEWQPMVGGAVAGCRWGLVDQQQETSCQQGNNKQAKLWSEVKATVFCSHLDLRCFLGSPHSPFLLRGQKDPPELRVLCPQAHAHGRRLSFVRTKQSATVQPINNIFLSQ